MSDVKFYDSVSLPKGDFFHKQWAKPSVTLNGEVISSEIEDLEIKAPNGMKPYSTPPLDEEFSFTIELEKEESDRLRKMLWLDKMERLHLLPRWIVQAFRRVQDHEARL